MADGKKGVKPDKEGGKSVPKEGEEVQGHAYEVLMICWNCGVSGWTPAHWHYYNCWYCGALNHMPH